MNYKEVVGSELYLIKKKWSEFLPGDTVLKVFIYPCGGIVLTSKDELGDLYTLLISSVEVLLTCDDIDFDDFMANSLWHLTLEKLYNMLGKNTYKQLIDQAS